MLDALALEHQPGGVGGVRRPRAYRVAFTRGTLRYRVRVRAASADAADRLALAWPTTSAARSCCVVEHSGEGAFGLVLNRPSDVTVGDAVPELAESDRHRARAPLGRPGAADGGHRDRRTRGPSRGDEADRRRRRHGGPRRPARARAAARVRGLRRLGAGQLEEELEPRPGSSTRPVSRTSSPNPTATFGRRCSSEREASSRCWRGCRPTPRSTELAQASPSMIAVAVGMKTSLRAAWARAWLRRRSARGRARPPRSRVPRSRCRRAASARR